MANYGPLFDKYMAVSPHEFRSVPLMARRWDLWTAMARLFPRWLDDGTYARIVSLMAGCGSIIGVVPRDGRQPLRYLGDG